jgi:plastocyanin
MTKIRSTILLATLAAALLAAAAPAGLASSSKSVAVGDNFFSPTKLTVAARTKIVWKWRADNTDSHDVYLLKGPKGVKKFQSDPAATDFRYSQKLSVPGSYRIVCTFHEGMAQTITVKKPS